MAEGNKFLDYTGLSHLWGKIKAQFVQKAGDTMTGTLIMPTGSAVKGTGEYEEIEYLNSSGERTAALAVNNTSRKASWLIECGDTEYHENFVLPAPDTGRTANKNWDILTSKTPVTIDQGGTGATTAEAARTNLGAAPLVSPALTGTPTAPTAEAETNTTQIATTAFANAAVQREVNKRGTEIPSNSDLNNYTTPGIYAIDSKEVAATLANCPFTGGNSRLEVMMTGSPVTDYMIQILAASSPKNTVFIRKRNGGNWYGWVELAEKESLIYDVGSTFTVATSLLLAAVVTGSGKRIITTIVTPKSLEKINTITVTSLKGGIRVPSGGYLGCGNAKAPWESSDTMQWVGASGITITARKSADHLIQLNMDSETSFTQGNTKTALTNNIPVSFYANWLLTFA